MGGTLRETLYDAYRSIADYYQIDLSVGGGWPVEPDDHQMIMSDLEDLAGSLVLSGKVPAEEAVRVMDEIEQEYQRYVCSVGSEQGRGSY